MKITITILFLMILSLTAFGQSKPASRKPGAAKITEIYSSVFDIKSFEKYLTLVSSENSHLKTEAIEQVLGRESSIKPVYKISEAQFVIIYQETKTGSSMRVQYNKEDQNVIVWAEDRKEKGKETELAEEFLKVLRRNKKLDVPDAPGDAR